MRAETRDGGEGGIRTHVPDFSDHPISSRRRYDRFGTSPCVPILAEGLARERFEATIKPLFRTHRGGGLESATDNTRMRPLSLDRPPDLIEGKQVKLLFIAALIVSGAALAAEPRLTIQSGSKTVSFTLSDLLKRPGVRTVAVSADPSYAGQARTYRAVAAAELFRGIEISTSGTVVFKCLDGFSGPLNASDLLNTDPQKSIAFIALEDPNKKWPPLKPGQSATAGPFYLVWQNPEKSNIAREMWPSQLAALEVTTDLPSLFPKIVPKSQDKNVQAGFTSFIRNCFMCHTLNGQGTSQLGPDLNIPFNPTEYMGEKYLRHLIRDPQSLRRWPQSKMSGFSPRDLADSELDQIVAYLRAMSGQKAQ